MPILWMLRSGGTKDRNTCQPYALSLAHVWAQAWAQENNGRERSCVIPPAFVHLVQGTCLVDGLRSSDPLLTGSCLHGCMGTCVRHLKPLFTC